LQREIPKEQVQKLITAIPRESAEAEKGAGAEGDCQDSDGIGVASLSPVDPFYVWLPAA